MKKQKGFSLIEVILVILVLVVIAGAGWFAWQARKDDSKTPTQSAADQSATEYTRTTTVPTDWKTYENSQYKLKFSYPANWKVTSDSKGNPSQFDYEVGVGANEQTYDILFGIKKQSLAETAANFTKSLGSNGEIIADTDITIDGNAAKEIRYKQVTAPGTDTAEEIQYFVYANGYTYTLPPVTQQAFVGGFTAKDLLTLVESTRISQ